MNIAAAVSGGMDSLLALALLREQGHEVLAVHGFFLPGKDERAAEALGRQCAALGVPFLALDLRARFEAEVAAPFALAWARGETPNPCARCNPAMKFGALFDAAREHAPTHLGKHMGTHMATHLATGHYARLLDHPALGRLLTRGADRSKDQSYFLSLLPREALARAVFPLGTMRKAEVPGELARRGLEPPLPSESQEICFVPGDDYQAYLEARAARLGAPLPGPGAMVLASEADEADEANENHEADGDGDRGERVVGRHGGLWRYTQGQRRGLGIAHSEPLYVLDKDVEANRLIVGPRRMLGAVGCECGGVNLLVPVAHWPERVLVQTRYRQQAREARITLEEGRMAVRFAEPRDRPAPGQVCAVYGGPGSALEGVVLAGAVIRGILEEGGA